MMTRILVSPERMRQLGDSCQTVASDLRNVNGRVERAANGLEWETRAQGSIRKDVDRARALGTDLASQAEAMSSFLKRKADAFKSADQRGYDDMLKLWEAYPVAGASASLLIDFDRANWLGDFGSRFREFVSNALEGVRQGLPTPGDVREFLRSLRRIDDHLGTGRAMTSAGKFLVKLARAARPLEMLSTSWEFWRFFGRGETTFQELAETIFVAAFLGKAVAVLGGITVAAVGAVAGVTLSPLLVLGISVALAAVIVPTFVRVGVDALMPQDIKNRKVNDLIRPAGDRNDPAPGSNGANRNSGASSTTPIRPTPVPTPSPQTPVPGSAQTTPGAISTPVVTPFDLERVQQNIDQLATTLPRNASNAIECVEYVKAQRVELGAEPIGPAGGATGYAENYIDTFTGNGGKTFNTSTDTIEAGTVIVIPGNTSNGLWKTYDAGHVVIVDAIVGDKVYISESNYPLGGAPIIKEYSLSDLAGYFMIPPGVKVPSATKR